jgi:hypothetical protein
MANPRKILAIKVRRTGGVTSGERFGLAHFSNGLWFFDDFSKLDSFSGFKACSFDVTWDFERWLFIVGQ